MKRFGIVLLVFMFAISLGGCSCLQKEVKSEAPPAKVVAQAPPKAPEPVKPAPPAPAPKPKKDRN